MNTPEYLPREIDELKKMNVDWSVVTNSFDHDTMKTIIGLWEKYEDRRAVAWMMSSRMTPDTLGGKSQAHIQANLDLLCLFKYKEGSKEYDILEQRMQHYEEIMKEEEWKEMVSSNKYLKQRVEELEAQLKVAKEENKALLDGLTELDSLRDKYDEAEEESSNWRFQYEMIKEDLQKENKLLRDLLNEKTDNKKFSVRQISIVAHALCKKAEVLTKNKKNISQLFNYMTGSSANTIGQNMCSTYSDEELEQIAKEIEEKMPEFAEYLREKTFFLPEMKK